MVKRNDSDHGYLSAGLNLPSSIPTKIKNEILEIISTTKFEKISFALSAYRKLIDPKAADNDERINTVGFIKDYNPDTNIFRVGLFMGSKEIVQKFVNPIITPIYSVTNKGELGVITKLIIEPGPVIVNQNNNNTVNVDDVVIIHESVSIKEDTEKEDCNTIKIPDEVKQKINE